MTEERSRTRGMCVAGALTGVLLATALAQAQNEAVTFARYLRESAIPTNVIDTFLNGNSRAQFDSEFGYILAKAGEFARQHDKKLLVVLFDPSRVLPQLVEGRPRYDQEIVDFLRENRFTYFDMNVVHAEDFKCFRLTYEQYRRRYLIGHYSPSGNHFFALRSRTLSSTGWIPSPSPTGPVTRV
jgi:hypothetical protein